jgi:hypothetical protein
MHSDTICTHKVHAKVYVHPRWKRGTVSTLMAESSVTNMSISNFSTPPTVVLLLGYRIYFTSNPHIAFQVHTYGKGRETKAK